MEMERRLQQMMERLFARQSEEMKSDINAEAKARHDQFHQDIKGNTEAVINSARSDIERSLHQQMGAIPEGSTSFGIRVTTCQVSS
jgi:hypothetical protein